MYYTYKFLYPNSPSLNALNLLEPIYPAVNVVRVTIPVPIVNLVSLAAKRFSVKMSDSESEQSLFEQSDSEEYIPDTESDSCSNESITNSIILEGLHISSEEEVEDPGIIWASVSGRTLKTFHCKDTFSIIGTNMNLDAKLTQRIFSIKW